MSTNITKSKILIVDDRIENIIALERVLEHLDVVFVRAQNGNDAVLAAIEEEFALILLDVQMPNMDGFETAAFIRKDGVNHSTPVIFISAIYKDDYYKVKGVQSGAVDFITKPFIEEVVVGKVEVFIEMFSQKQLILQQMHEADRIKNYLKKLINTFPSMIIGINDDGQVQFWNEDAEKFSEISGDKVEGMLVSDIFTDIPLEFDKIIEAIRLKQEYAYNGLACKIKGVEYYFDINAYPVISSDSSGVIRVDNVTDKIHIEKQLAQAQKMESIGTLAGGIAHDFNNILFPILGHTEMLLQDIPEESPAHNALKKIHSGAIRARDLVSQILTFSRQENKKIMRIKIQPIVKETLKLIRSVIPATIKINQYIDKDCRKIKADPTQIHSIIMNLTTNASHAMKESDGELTVSLKETQLNEHDIVTLDMVPGIYVCLSVTDTGEGIDKFVIDKIFDPFFTTKEKGKGTGMGLSVVHGIVKSVGGVIQVNSEAGKGTEFHVYLPVAESFSKKQNSISKTEIKGGTERILLVDDEKDILTMEKEMLERLGYKVTSRISSIEALEAFKANPDRFDIVITDMAMPNMAGDKLSVELTKIRPDIPILICTGFSETMSEAKAAVMGIKGFVLKPIVMQDFSQKVREVLDNNMA